MLEWLDRLGRLGGWLVSVVRPPLKVEVSYMSLDRVCREPGSPVVFITAYPIRYYASVRITNRAAQPVFVRAVNLRVGELILSSASLPVKRLEPDDYIEADIIFPTADEDQPAEVGEFRIEVVPTRGRTARASGLFPCPQNLAGQA